MIFLEHDTRELSERSKAEWDMLAADAAARGVDLPSMRNQVDREALHTPQCSKKFYEVLISESFGDGNKDGVAQSKGGWSWDLYRLPNNKLPAAVFDLHSSSPTVGILKRLFGFLLFRLLSNSLNLVFVPAATQSGRSVTR